MKKKKKWDIVWFCSHCNKLPKTEIKLEGKFFAQNIDEIVFNTKSTSKELLKKFNGLHKNLQLKLKIEDGNGEMTFLDMNIYVRRKTHIHAIGTISLLIHL